MITFQITYQWPNGDWTWLDVTVRDFQCAIGEAISQIPDTCRIHNITRLPHFSPDLAVRAKQRTS